MPRLRNDEPAASDNAERVPLWLLVCDGDRIREASLAVQAMKPTTRARLLTLRRELDAATAGGPYDVRHMLTLDGSRRERWQAARHLWIVERFAGDPRVDGKEG